MISGIAIRLLHRQGVSWTEIGRLVGQRKLSITADTYSHVMVDPREVDYAALLDSEVAPVHARDGINVHV